MTDLSIPSELAAPAGRAAPAGYPDHAQAVQLYGATIAEEPSELYRRIRRRFGPVAPILLEGDVPAWLVLGYREVHHITSNPQWFARDSRRWNMWDRVPPDWPLMPYVAWNPSLMFAEGAEHQRRAGAVGDVLDAVNRTELTAIVEQVADRLIDGFAGDGQADLVAQYATRIPAPVVARLLGVAEVDIPAMAADVFASIDGQEEAIPAYQRLHNRMQHLVAERHKAPTSDVPSRLIAHPAQLTDDQIVLDTLIVLAAAQFPTSNWIGNALRLMLVDDHFSVTLQGGRSSAAQALNEVLWKDTPTQNMIGRWAVQDCELGRWRVRRGDLLVLGLAAANTDPQVQPQSHVDSGANRAHMSFGHGEHGCPFPAPELGEIMVKTAVEVLLDRLPDVALAVAAEEIRWRPTVWARALVSLPVSFTPTAPISPALA